MNSTFKTIGIISKLNGPTIGTTTETVVDFLLEQGLAIVLEQSASSNLSKPYALPVVELAELGNHCDLAIVIGGDGTLLSAACTLADMDVPLVGINLGRLGFLVDISPSEMLQRLGEILLGDFYEEQRFLLHSSVIREDKVINEGTAFNDVVIHKWNSVRMIEFETFVNNQLVNSQRSDGLIISTPTGSTAYALSGGGPILHPSLNAMTLVPICPHTLSNRPLVIDGDSEVELVVKEGHEDYVRITLDGRANFGIHDHDHIKITKYGKSVRLIHPKNHDHFQILRAKLRWG